MMTTLLFVTPAIVNAQDLELPEINIEIPEIPEIDLTPPVLGTYTGPEADKATNLAKALTGAASCATGDDYTPEALVALASKPLEEQYEFACKQNNCVLSKWEDDGILGSDGVYSGNFQVCEVQATLYRATCEIDCTRAGAGEIFVMPILTLLALLI